MKLIHGELRYICNRCGSCTCRGAHFTIISPCWGDRFGGFVLSFGKSESGPVSFMLCGYVVKRLALGSGFLANMPCAQQPDEM